MLDEEVFRVRDEGPRNYFEAEFVYKMFADASQRCMVATDHEKLRSYVTICHQWMRWLDMARAFRNSETRMLETCSRSFRVPIDAVFRPGKSGDY